MDKDTNKDKIGGEIRSLRLLLGLNQTELAKKAGFTPAAISHFEGGVRRPCIANLIKLCKALEVTPNRLLGWEEDELNENKQVLARAVVAYLDSKNKSGEA